MRTGRSVISRIQVAAILLGALAGPAAAQVPQPQHTAVEREEAERAFQRANTHYNLGEYDLAIPLFKRAYQFSGEPTLIFNIAQAHRLAGDCHRAIEAYRQFLRLSSDPALRVTAETHSQSLRRSCLPPPPSAAAAIGASPQVTAPPARPSPAEVSPWRNIGLGGLAGGLFAGAAAAGLYVWNEPRFDTWSQEDRSLGARGGGGEPAEAVRRQETNDELWRSIKSADRATVALAIAGATLTVAGGVLMFVHRSKEKPVTVSFTGTGIVGRVQWR